MRAGDWASTVPDTLVAEGRYGVAVGEDPAAARGMFEEAVARAASADPWLAGHPPRVEWWGGRFDPAQTPADDPVVVVVSEAAAVVTGAPSPRAAHVTARTCACSPMGRIATVMFGPGDVRVAHMADEYVPVADLQAAARTLVVAALRFCGAED